MRNYFGRNTYYGNDIGLSIISKAPLKDSKNHHLKPDTHSSSSKIISIILTLLALCHSTLALSITKVYSPLVADLRRPTDLSCHFDMGAEELYAIKWYKDDQEFLRYMPTKISPISSFPVAGVHLDLKAVNCSIFSCKIRLQRLSRVHSGGAYRCEISSEAPTFRLASETHNLTVAALPMDVPRIEGLAGPYGEGDLISANCISDLSDPAPILSWLLNNQEVTSKHTGEMVSSDPDHEGLVARSLTLRYRVDRKLSQMDQIQLKCMAALPGIPEQPLTVVRTVSTKKEQPEAVNNQKLYWYYSSSVADHRNSNSFLIVIIMSSFAILRNVANKCE